MWCGVLQVVADHPTVAEVAVVGVQDELRGQVPIALFVKLDNAGNTQSDAQIVQDLIGMVRGRIGAIACFKDGIAVTRLPKTRSGKVLRSTLRRIANGETDIKVPATIEDVTVLDEIRTALDLYRT